MVNRLTTFLDEHEGIAEKNKSAECPFDLLKDTDDAEEILDGTMYTEGSQINSEGNYFIYRSCGKIACVAECAIVVNDKGHILDSARFIAPCTGKL